MEEKITFGKFIVKKRKAKQLTQKELAQQLYVSESAVSKWERGISYPDISLISLLCQILEVSEHELMTCSDDFKQKETERQAQYFRGIMKTYSIFFYVFYAISLCICLIVNIALENRLSWFFVVLAAEMVAFTITSLPYLIKGENKHWIVLGCFYIAVNILLGVSCLYTRGDWFVVTSVCITFGFVCLFLPFLLRDLPLPPKLYGHKTLLYLSVITLLLFGMIAICMNDAGDISLFMNIAVPVTLLSLLPIWLIILLIRYLKVHKFWKISLCLFIAAITVFFLNSLLNAIIFQKAFVFPLVQLLNWSEPYLDGNIKFIVCVILIILAIAFAIGGIFLQIKEDKNVM